MFSILIGDEGNEISRKEITGEGPDSYFHPMSRLKRPFNGKYKRLNLFCHFFGSYGNGNIQYYISLHFLYMIASISPLYAQAFHQF